MRHVTLDHLVSLAVIYLDSIRSQRIARLDIIDNRLERITTLSRSWFFLERVHLDGCTQYFGNLALRLLDLLGTRLGLFG